MRKKKYKLQMSIWNLKCAERIVGDKGYSAAAYSIREVLDILSPNWRKAKEYKDIEVYSFVKGVKKE